VAWDNAQAITDFEEIQLDEFGESAVFINGTTSAQTTISAVRSIIGRNQPPLKNSTTGQNRAKIELLISRGTLGKSNIRPDIDKIKLRVEPNDSFDKTLLVRYVENEYGAWRVGLG